MKIKLASLVFVAILLACSCSGIIAVTHTEVVSGATSVSAQTAPQSAPLNPAFVKYQQRLSAANSQTGTSAPASSGFVPPPINLTQLKGQSIRSALVGSASLPASYDLRTLNKLTSVKDQGSCGDCWAFGAYASLESYLRPSETWDFSESHMNNNHGFDIPPCAGGNDFMATAYLARWSGPVNEGSNGPVQKHVQNVYFIPDRASSTDNANIKSAIMTYGAVYTQTYIAPSYTPPYYNPSTHAYYDPYTTAVDHGVAIVGWNDNYAAGNFIPSPPGNGAWIVKNSWGTGWGDNGYYYVSYYDANIGQYNAAFTARPTTNYNNIYQYDPLGATDSFGQGSRSEWGANVFTAQASESLAAVSFYTFSLNAPYDVYVYTDPTSGPISTSGPVGHVSGALALPGYHTISLTSGIPLRAGQKFSVVVKFTSTSSYEDYNYPVPIESPIAGYSSQATAQAGQSYYHADDGSWQSSTWTDMTSSSANTNICIKAFTAPWTSLGGQIPAGTSPAACSWGAGRLDLFVQGTNGALYHKWYTGSTWSGWENLGGVLTSSPAATSPGNGVIDVFVRGTNGALYEKTTTDGGKTWSSWIPLGGQIPAGTSPAACSWGAGRLDLFVQGTNGALYHKWYTGSTWSGWENLGGVLTSSPAATSPASSRIDVFVRGTNGAPYQRSWTGSWSSWTSLGGQIPAGTSPAACSWGAGRLDLFVQGTNGALYHKWYTGSTWSGWENLGGKLTSSPAAAAAPGSSRIDVFVRGGNGAIWQKTL